ncbi:MAG: S-layer homology domain-containing protein [Chloroflexota bacterium]|nr:S-layer homology domain-containing protein [Chloroflexota bacterium]
MPHTHHIGAPICDDSPARRGHIRFRILLPTLLSACCLFLLSVLVIHDPAAAFFAAKAGNTNKHTSVALPPAKGNSALPYETGPVAQVKSPDRTGGPDAFGYVFADNRDPGGPVYNWQPGIDRIADASWSTVRHQNIADPLDDGVYTTTLPFAFPFYGSNYSTIHISTNGNVHFGAPNDYYPDASCLPTNSEYVPKGMIAPLWYDFVVPTAASGEGGVYTTILGSSPNRQFVVEWRNVYDYNSNSSRATFEVLLSENGEIDFQYMALNGTGVNGSGGTIGIQNVAADTGLSYSCHQDAIVPERAIRYMLLQSAILNPGTTAGGGAKGATVTYSQTLLNQTGIDNSFSLSVSGRSWTTTVEPANTGMVLRGRSYPLTVRVQIPSSVAIGSSDVATLTVRSDLPQPGTYTATAIITTTATSTGVDFNPLARTQSGDYGSVLTYTSRLVNSSGRQNIFDLSLSNAQWPTSITPTRTNSLAAGASTPITAVVSIPSGAHLGDRDVAYVDASNEQPQIGQFTGEMVLTTTAGLWSQAAYMPVARSRGAAVTLPSNGQIYLIGGENNNGNTDLPVERYDPVVNSWTARVFLPVGVSNIGAAAIGSAIYIPGGYSGQSARAQSILQIYRPLENRVDVATADPMPAARLGAGVAAVNGKLYVAGGAGSDLHETNTLFEYDPARPAGSRWQTKAAMPFSSVYLAAAAVDGILYAVGGLNGLSTELNNVAAYDPATDTWSMRHSMSRARAGLAMVGVNSSQPGCGGYLYALGGGWASYLSTAERYDPSTDSWQAVSDLSRARRSLAAAYSTDTYKVIAFGGWTGNYESITEGVSCVGGLSYCSLRFPDVDAESPFYNYVRCLACQGIINGYADGTFKPGNSVSRGQLSKIVSNAAAFNDPASGQTYSDVAPGSPFYLWVERLSSMGIMSGYACGSVGEPCDGQNRPYFRPNDVASRGQIAKIVSNARGYNNTPRGQTYEDVPVSGAFYLWIERLSSRGIMSGYACGAQAEPCVAPGMRPYVRPNDIASRGQTAKIVSNSFFPACVQPPLK